MNPMLAQFVDQFIQESRDCLQSIGERLMALEDNPGDPDIMTELFRYVHTLKGNSGIFDFPEMTRMLHAGEDLMDAVRHGHLAFTQDMADGLLETIDYVGVMIDEIAATGDLGTGHGDASTRLAGLLRSFQSGTPQTNTPEPAPAPVTLSVVAETPPPAAPATATAEGLPPVLNLTLLPESVQALSAAPRDNGAVLLEVTYRPAADCFFSKEDPFQVMRNLPGLLWGAITPRSAWPVAEEYDCYQCLLDFQALVLAVPADVETHLRYVREQVRLTLLDQEATPPVTAASASPAAATPARDEVTQRLIDEVLDTQEVILQQSDEVLWLHGRLTAVAATLAPCLVALGQSTEGMEQALEKALFQESAAPLLRWLSQFRDQWVAGASAPSVTPEPEPVAVEEPVSAPVPPPAPTTTAAPAALAATPAPTEAATAPAAEAPPPNSFSFGKKNEEGSTAGKVLKVDQAKVDHLMNLIGEMVVAKNALPYLANRAENQYGVRELSREIKEQYAVINRIAEDMQDAIMQVRMMPVSFVFQRFPRLVRDIARKLGKDVDMILEGENTEADKHVIESLADPLIHIVRNSLDHGLETPDVRLAAGKPAQGKLLIRAQQESDRVIIEIIDDGKGINPTVIKQKALEKGIIDEAQAARLSDREAIHLIFAAGFSTAEQVTDLSGRGVGMDVVRTAIDRVGGSIDLTSEWGKGTRLRLSLPLSMAVTNVMIVESHGQIFGLPMDKVVETVRLPRSDIRTIKQQKTVVLRGRLVPLVALNDLLAVPAEPIANHEDELAALVVRVGNEQVGLLVDQFKGVVDVILKPLPGELGRLSCYAGTALLGDGSVLMVLNPKELF